ncbi:MAG: sporulation protein YqfD [Clostridia bacterium]|nr:sporulation protein YqfD [Clostridia bacterium]
MSFCHFCVSSRRLSSLINSLSSRRVPLYLPRRTPQGICFLVPSRYEKETKEVLDSLCLSYHTSPRGAKRLAFSLFARKGLWIVSIIALLVLTLLGGFVWSVDVSSPDPNIASLASKTLADAGIAPFLPIRSIDPKEIRALLLPIQGVAQVSVEFRGTTLFVSLLPSLPVGEPFEEDFSPIVASCDCIIQRIVVERGRALVKAGDTVRKGDVLIAPEYLLEENTAPAQALGQVYGYVYPTHSLVYSTHRVEQAPTGRSFRTTVLSIAGQTFSKPLPSPFTLYTTQHRTQIFDSALAVQLEEWTYFELEERVIFEDWTAVSPMVQQQAYEALLASIKKEVQIVRKWCIIKNEGSTYLVQAYAEALAEVGVKQAQWVEGEE